MTTATFSHLDDLRAELGRQGLDGFIIPMADEFQNEYPPDSAKRIEYTTGFTGSYGEAIVTHDNGVFFTDGRYTLQAEKQVIGAFALLNNNDPSASNYSTKAEWLKLNMPLGSRIGFDPWLHTDSEIRKLLEDLKGTGIELVEVRNNPIDAVWIDRPLPPCTPVVPHDLEYAGKDGLTKRQEIVAQMKVEGIDVAVITDPASVAWLLNIRGNDTPYTPLPISYALLFEDGSYNWFVDPKKSLDAGDVLFDHLGFEAEEQSLDRFTAILEALGEFTIRVDPDHTAFKIVDAARHSGAKINYGPDPTALARACKNQVEIDGARAAHKRDGVALVKFLEWVDINAPLGTVTESGAAAKLEEFRRAGILFKTLSFPTISGTGPNGAIIHYTESNLTPLVQNSFLLVDSGAQYLDGTTDVTRTIPIGEVSQEMKDHFTLVLKGHIRLAMAEFNSRTTGVELDAIARKPLNGAGLDYAHGTGHGVGSYLGVHEGPQRIAKKHQPAAHGTFYPGMIVSDEPGYYQAGDYGIRIENLLAVKKISDALGDALNFETLTLAPIDRRAINVGMLEPSESDWLDAYHARVYETLGPELSGTTRKWLANATAPING